MSHIIKMISAVKKFTSKAKKTKLIKKCRSFTNKGFSWVKSPFLSKVFWTNFKWE